MMHLLVEWGANVDFQIHNGGATTFHNACFGNKPCSVEALFRAGCDTSIKGETGLTGKALAENAGHATVLERLRVLVREEVERRLTVE